MKTIKVGIKQKIQSAKTVEEADQLLREVQGFQHAHPSTVRKCKKAHALKLKLLQLQ